MKICSLSLFNIGSYRLNLYYLIHNIFSWERIFFTYSEWGVILACLSNGFSGGLNSCAPHFLLADYQAVSSNVISEAIASEITLSG